MQRRNKTKDAGFPRLLITPGEPAGIGPDIVIAAAQKNWQAELIVVADPILLQQRAQQLQLPLTLSEANLDQPAKPHQAGKLKIIPVTLNTVCEPGQLNPENSAYVLRTLEIAAENCLQAKAQAIVTGPVQKNALNAANIRFTGHTEFFADYCRVKQTVMLFVADKLRVALLTTHLPLSEVPRAITQERLVQTLEILQQALQNWFGIAHPSVIVCGLNPHAGEAGYLGREEIEIIEPTLDRCRQAGMNLVGPLGADTVFTANFLPKHDAVLAMYHDQALPVVKQMSFGHAVNVTLGLPFIRTSVDHGTALDMAGTGGADAGSMEAAIELGLRLCNRTSS